MHAISIKKMKVLLSTVEEQSFTKASLKQNLSQPAVTIIIREIEELAGCELFVRSGNGRTTTLTDAGENIAMSFSKIVAQYEQEMLQLNSTVNGRKVEKEVCIQKSFAPAMSAEWLHSLRETFDGYKISFGTGTREEVLEKIHSKDACLGLIAGLSTSYKADFKTIYTDRLCAVVRDSDCSDARGVLTWSDLPQLGIVHTGLSREVQTRIRQSLDEVGIPRKNYMEVDSEVLIAKLVTAGNLVALMPYVIGSELDKYVDLRCLKLRDPVVDIPLRMVMPWGKMHSTQFDSLSPSAIFSEAIDE